MVRLADFVAARMTEEEAASRQRVPVGGVPGPPPARPAGGWRGVLADHAEAVPLTEHWVTLELQLRGLASRFSDHPDFEPRWRTGAVPSSRTRPSRQGVPGDGWQGADGPGRHSRWTTSS